MCRNKERKLSKAGTIPFKLPPPPRPSWSRTVDAHRRRGKLKNLQGNSSSTIQAQKRHRTNTWGASLHSEGQGRKRMSAERRPRGPSLRQARAGPGVPRLPREQRREVSGGIWSTWRLPARARPRAHGRESPGPGKVRSPACWGASCDFLPKLEKLPPLVPVDRTAQETPTESEWGSFGAFAQLCHEHTQHFFGYQETHPWSGVGALRPCLASQTSQCKPISTYKKSVKVRSSHPYLSSSCFRALSMFILCPTRVTPRSIRSSF